MGTHARFRIGLAAVLLIAVGSVATGLILYAEENADFHRLQKEEAAHSAHEVEALISFSVGQLSSAAAGLESERRLDPHTFHLIATSLLRRGALSDVWFVTAAQRPGRFPVALAEPASRAPSVLGYDLGSDPRHQPALHRARDSGGAVSSAIVRLPTDRSRGLVVYLPIYRDGAPTATAAQRRAALLGFAAGATPAARISAAANASTSEEISEQIRQNGRAVVGPRGPFEEADSAPINVAAHTWVLTVSDSRRPNAVLPVLLASGGLILAIVLGALIFAWSRNERMRELEREAGEDSLTGLKNRRRFEEELRTAMARSHREGTTGALLIVDLDDFKQVNDSLGHPAGDKLIEGVAEALRGRARESDVLARMGGDEFAIVLPRCGLDEAWVVADAISTAIREHGPAKDGAPSVTASIGIAMFGNDPQTSLESIVSEADTAMYAAKDAGRDRVQIFDRRTVHADRSPPH